MATDIAAFYLASINEDGDASSHKAAVFKVGLLYKILGAIHAVLLKIETLAAMYVAAKRSAKDALSEAKLGVGITLMARNKCVIKEAKLGFSRALDVAALSLYDAKSALGVMIDEVPDTEHPVVYHSFGGA